MTKNDHQQGSFPNKVTYTAQKFETSISQHCNNQWELETPLKLFFFSSPSLITPTKETQWDLSNKKKDLQQQQCIPIKLNSQLPQDAI